MLVILHPSKNQLRLLNGSGLAVVRGRLIGTTICLINMRTSSASIAISYLDKIVNDV